MKNTGLIILFLFPVLLGGALYINSMRDGNVESANTKNDLFSYNKESQSAKQESQETTQPTVTELNDTAPAMEIDAKKTYTATLKTTKGDIVVQLNAAATPITVNNFVVLARKHFYDKTIFHRVIKGFMIQGGDPKGNGTGGPGYRFKDEPFEGEYTRGTIAMANAGPNTNGSQFFIMHQDYPLPKNYVIFGKVVQGLDVVDKIAESEVKAGMSGENSTPVDPTVVQSVEIAEQ